MTTVSKTAEDWEKAWDKFSSSYDNFGDEWQDMGADEMFKAGYESAAKRNADAEQVIDELVQAASQAREVLKGLRSALRSARIPCEKLGLAINKARQYRDTIRALDVNQIVKE